MKTSSTVIIGFCRSLLALYPAPFRREYSEEFELVFRLGLQEAGCASPLGLAWFCARELLDFPGALLAAHIRELQARKEDDRMEQANPPISLPLFVQWVLATTLGHSLAWIAFTPVFAYVQPFALVDEDRLFLIMVPLLLGFAGGTAQWLVLRHYIPRAGRWIVATIAGYAAILLLVWLMNSLRLMIDSGIAGLMVMLTLGAVLGLPQALVLRTHAAGVGLWVVANAVSLMAYQFGSTFPAHNSTDLVRLGSVEGMVFGIVTGISISWLLRPTTPMRLASG